MAFALLDLAQAKGLRYERRAQYLPGVCGPRGSFRVSTHARVWSAGVPVCRCEWFVWLVGLSLASVDALLVVGCCQWWLCGILCVWPCWRVCVLNVLWYGDSLLW